jgi:hypothetical protein
MVITSDLIMDMEGLILTVMEKPMVIKQAMAILDIGITVVIEILMTNKADKNLGIHLRSKKPRCQVN